MSDRNTKPEIDVRQPPRSRGPRPGQEEAPARVEEAVLRRRRAWLATHEIPGLTLESLQRMRETRKTW